MISAGTSFTYDGIHTEATRVEIVGPTVYLSSIAAVFEINSLSLIENVTPSLKCNAPPSVPMFLKNVDSDNVIILVVPTE